jgi:tetratricopeptide (TPR) repeat protein
MKAWLHFRILALCMVIGLAGACSTDANERSEQLTEEAREILRGGQSEKQLTEALELTRRATDADETYIPAYTTRINILMRQGKADALAQQAEKLVEIEPHYENRLYLCMAQEFANPEQEGTKDCYQGLADEMEAEGRASAAEETYLLALRMAGDDTFDQALERYMSDLDSEVAREMAHFKFVEGRRDEIIQRLFQP